MKRSSFRILSTAALAWTVFAQSPGQAATLSDSRHGVPPQGQDKPQARLVLPPRSEVLVVDWVDAKNAKIGIGGITYMLKGAPLPHIVLSGGEQVTNIGYLKSGMRVRIRTRPDGPGHARLSEITVEG